MSHFQPLWGKLRFAFEGMKVVLGGFFFALATAECRRWQGGVVSNRAVSALWVARQVLTA